MLLGRVNPGDTADTIGRLEMQVLDLCEGRSGAAIDRGGKVGNCETIQKHPPFSEGKFLSVHICRRSSDRDSVGGIRSRWRAGD